MRSKARAAALDPDTAAKLARVRESLSAARYQPPSPRELATKLALPEKELALLLEAAADRGELVFVTREFVLTHELYASARSAIVANCGKHGSLDIPSLRDELATTRKFLIPLLEHFDVQGLTLRQGANRVLRKR